MFLESGITFAPLEQKLDGVGNAFFIGFVKFRTTNDTAGTESNRIDHIDKRHAIFTTKLIIGIGQIRNEVHHLVFCLHVFGVHFHREKVIVDSAHAVAEHAEEKFLLRLEELILFVGENFARLIFFIERRSQIAQFGQKFSVA